MKLSAAKPFKFQCQNDIWSLVLGPALISRSPLQTSSNWISNLHSTNYKKEPLFFISWHWFLRHDVQVWCSKINRFQSSGVDAVNGVDDCIIKSHYWIFQVWLPLFNGSDAVFSGDLIKMDFPDYPLKKKLQGNVINSYKQHGGNPSVPKLL